MQPVPSKEGTTKRVLFKNAGHMIAGAIAHTLLPNVDKSTAKEERITPQEILNRCYTFLQVIDADPNDKKIFETELEMFSYYYNKLAPEKEVFTKLINQRQPNNANTLLEYFNGTMGLIENVDLSDSYVFDDFITYYRHDPTQNLVNVYSALLYVKTLQEKQNPQSKEIFAHNARLYKRFQEETEGLISSGANDQVKTTETNQAFLKDTQTAIDILTGLPISLETLNTKIKILSPSRYGLGKEKTSTGYRWMGEIGIDRDKALEIAEKYYIHTILHEALGHGLTALRNLAFANMLSPQQLHDTLLLEQQILWDKNWGALDGSIEDLFFIPKGKRLHRLDPKTYSLLGTKEIAPDQLRDLITQYPREHILENGYKMQTHTADEMDVTFPLSMYDEFSEQKGKQVLINFKMPKGQVRQDFFSNYDYDSFGAFLKKQMPSLKEAADAGSRRMKIIVWGLEKFWPVFEDMDFLTKPEFSQTRRATNAFWINYCMNEVLNGILYDAVINNRKEIMSMFSQEEAVGLRKNCLNLRAVSRLEVLAEGVSYACSDWINGRENPYQQLLLHADLMLKQIGQEPSAEELHEAIQKETVYYLHQAVLDKARKAA